MEFPQCKARHGALTPRGPARRWATNISAANGCTNARRGSGRFRVIVHVRISRRTRLTRQADVDLEYYRFILIFPQVCTSMTLVTVLPSEKGITNFTGKVRATKRKCCKQKYVCGMLFKMHPDAADFSPSRPCRCRSMYRNLGMGAETIYSP